MEETTPQAPDNHAAPAAPSHGPAWAALGLALIAVGAVAYLLIADRSEQKGMESLTTQLRAQIQQLDDRLAEQTKLGEARTAELSTLTQNLAQSLSRTARERAVLDAANLLDLANQRLQFAYDVKGAMQSLHLADDRLRNTTDANLNAIRRAIAEDVVRLRAVASVDSPGIQAKLHGLIGQIEHLPLRNQRVPEREQISAPRAGLNTWQDWVAAIWTELRRLIVVRYNDKPVAPLLPPDQAVYLLQNLKLKLEEARLAVLLHDQTAYTQSLSSALQWLQEYFNSATPSVAAVAASIKELQAFNVQPTLPDISNTLRLLQKRAQELGLADVS